MKKIFFMLVAVFGMAFAANAQADQCKLESGNGGYIDAFVSEKNLEGKGQSPHVVITTTPSKDQPSGGKVLCKITYVRLDNGEEESVTASLTFFAHGSCSGNANWVNLDHPASRIKKIEIWGAECKSASRPW